MNVLVCASSTSRSHGLSNALRSVLSPFYTVQSVLPVSLATRPWTASCALLVLLPPDDTLPTGHEAIQQYISAGGRILGIGLGATVLPHRQVRERSGLWDARSGTAIVPQYPQAVPSPSLPSSILLQTGALLSGLRRASVSFVLTRDASDIQVIRGRWEEPVGAIAGIQVPVGSGRAAFWDISPCFDGIEDTENVTALLRYALTDLGLSLPPETTTDNESSDLPFSIPRYALPQFLLHPRGKRRITDTILQRLGNISSTIDSELSGESEPVLAIKDRVDTFHFHKVATLEHGARLLAEAKASADASDAPRLVVVLPPDVLPTFELTPRFDAEKYFAVLAEVRGDQMSAAESWGVGEALFYGEAVTSTQTMLERNPRFLASLQAPIVSLATFQLSGRGRGSNTWLSPAGCLQFSILVRAPLRGASGLLSASRLVFVQYLVGLAIVRACRDERALGAERGARVRLKWPNDVYIDLPTSPLVPGGGKKKVGGVLVNTSFADGNADVIIGCGINVSTPAPVTALDLLCRPGEYLDAETVLALVLTEFEPLWTAFVAGRGSWAPFEEAYLDMWMHSDQLVTLTTVDPPVSVRIVGITHDHGLLRTIPERTGWGRNTRHGVDDEYIDLQPDGNSFDIMMGLIKAKK